MMNPSTSMMGGAFRAPELDEKERTLATQRFLAYDKDHHGALSKLQFRAFLIDYFVPSKNPSQFELDTIDNALWPLSDNIDLWQAINIIAQVKAKISSMQPMQLKGYPEPSYPSTYTQPQQHTPMFTPPPPNFSSNPFASAQPPNPFMSTAPPPSSSFNAFNNNLYPASQPYSQPSAPLAQYGYPPAAYPTASTSAPPLFDSFALSKPNTPMEPFAPFASTTTPSSSSDFFSAPAVRPLTTSTIQPPPAPITATAPTKSLISVAAPNSMINKPPAAMGKPVAPAVGLSKPAAPVATNKPAAPLGLGKPPASVLSKAPAALMGKPPAAVASKLPAQVVSKPPAALLKKPSAAPMITPATSTTTSDNVARSMSMPPVQSLPQVQMLPKLQVMPQVQKAPQSKTAPATTAAMGTHFVSVDERRAFAEHLNSVQQLRDDQSLAGLLPIDPNSDQLFTAVSDGALFCKYLNAIKPGIINDASIKVKPRNTFEKSENHIKALDAAKKLGCSIVNIGPEDLIQGKPHLVMGLVWQLIKHDLLSKVSLREHPEIYRLASDGSTSLKEITESAPEDVLLRWMNYHLRNAGYRKPVSNFSEDLRDGTAYAALMHQIAPEVCSLDALNEQDPMVRAMMIVQNAQMLNCDKFVTPTDILSGNAKLNLAFAADLFNKRSALNLPTLEEFQNVRKQNAQMSDLLDDAEARLRQILADQQLAYQLQQQEIQLYKEQKMREQRQLAEQEAMLIAQQQQEMEMIEQQKRLKNMALQEQEALAVAEQRREQERYDEMQRLKKTQVQIDEDFVREQQREEERRAQLSSSSTYNTNSRDSFGANRSASSYSSSSRASYSTQQPTRSSSFYSSSSSSSSGYGARKAGGSSTIGDYAHESTFSRGGSSPRMLSPPRSSRAHRTVTTTTTTTPTPPPPAPLYTVTAATNTYSYHRPGAFTRMGRKLDKAWDRVTH